MDSGESFPDVKVWRLPGPVPDAFGAHAPRVRMSARTLAAIHQQALANRGVEVGGMLVGEVSARGSGVDLHVTACISAEATDAGRAHLTFTHETWQRMRERRWAQHAGAVDVGWYHSHPGLGVFVSGMDCDLHSRVFAAQPWCIAVVVDPEQGSAGAFWIDPADGHVRQLEMIASE